ncbi:MAG: hypothetical protein ABI557_19605 [Aureliella sp.]
MSHIRLDNPNDSWKPCQPGELSQLAQRDVRKRSSIRSLTVVGAVASGVACALLLVASMGLMGQGSRPASDVSPFGSAAGVSSVSVRYTCRDAVECRDRFLLGIASVEAQAAVREHLSHCPHCQSAYRTRAQELKVEYTVLVLPSSVTTTFASR